MDDRRVTILYVDDEPANLEVLPAVLGGEYDVRTAPSGAEALEMLVSGQIAVLVTDQRMPGMSGVQLLAEASARWPEVVPIVITAYRDTDLIIGAIRAGHVHDYIIKPWNLEHLRRTVAGAVEEHLRRRRLADVARDRAALEEDVLRRYDPSRVVGEEGGLRDVMRTVRAVAPSDSTVLLIGETGTGKEMIARAIHSLSPRRHRAPVKVDCASLAPTLVESELFGHRRGAFTGAMHDRAGRFELADGGTIFLDEVDDLSPEMQGKLLQVLQDRVVQRLGGDGPIAVDVRVIAAARRDLRAVVAAGGFREDLYYRLCVVPIVLPPLRARLDDIPALVRHFLEKHGRSLMRYEVDEAALAALRAYRWPGNVREMENLIERTLVLGAGPRLSAADLALPPGEIDVAPP
ncbi:MAG: sigma-54 dependent transcriptional regulator, partial [Myxococcota bacterium]|nr:sigma-54 dependent transcriptional regulator [Myxococcota bacterium]